MNTKNNKRKRDSIEKITKVFIELLQSQELSEISVTELCKRAGLNRATFYTNYIDIYDLAEKTLNSLKEQVNDVYSEELSQGFNSNDYTKLLRHIYENQIYYQTCFKLGIGDMPVERYDTAEAEKYFPDKNILYHIEFFRAGFNRIVKLWLDGGCRETPEEIAQVIKDEYQGRER